MEYPPPINQLSRLSQAIMSALIAILPLLGGSTVTVKVLASVAAMTVLWCAYNRFLHPLASLPGPTSARWGLPFWQAWHAYRTDYVRPARFLGPTART